MATEQRLIDPANAVDVAKVEALLSQVRGVFALRVVLDLHGQIDELHVVGSPSRSAKQIVRDIESLLYVRAGIRVDHRKISLVQIDAATVQPALVRVQLLGIVRSGPEQTPTLTITLSMGEQHVQGIGSNQTGMHNTLETLAGQATIHALDQLIGSRGQFRLENTQRQLFGDLDVQLAHLSLHTLGSIETLLGISIVRGDELAAVVRSILDAVNRRLQWLLSIPI